MTGALPRTTSGTPSYSLAKDCAHCGQQIKWCDNPICPRITHHLIHVETGIGACRGNQTTALLLPDAVTDT